MIGAQLRSSFSVLELLSSRRDRVCIKFLLKKKKKALNQWSTRNRGGENGKGNDPRLAQADTLGFVGISMT